MLMQSQPLDPKVCEKMGLDKKDDDSGFSDDKIKEQFIGNMFDRFFGDDGKQKITLGLRLHWLNRSIKDFIFDTKYAIRNHFKWRKTVRKLRPWDGYGGLISVMITHLNDYIETEIKYGHSLEEYKQGELDSDKDFDRLGQLLKENLFSWWD